MLLAFPLIYMSLAKQCWVSIAGLLQHLHGFSVQLGYSCWQHPGRLEVMKIPLLTQVGMCVLISESSFA